MLIRLSAFVFCLQVSLFAADSLQSRVEAQLPQLLETYRHLHSNPELSYFEKETASYVSTRLREFGFEVSEGIGDYGVQGRRSYGLVGVLKNGPGPTVMVRTDLDALPVDEKTGLPYASKVRAVTEEGVETGVMHACGHDLHMTVFLGTAQVLAQTRDSWKGTLIMIGQPAEERGAGAEAMLKGGLYERFGKPDYVLALHSAPELPAGQVGYREGYALAAVDSVDIRVRGLGGHGAYPQSTKDPVVLAAQIVLALQTIVSRTVSPFDPAVVTVGAIHGGAKHNIIPDFVDLQLTIRSYKPEVRKVILDSIRRIVDGQARAAGIPVDLLPVVKISENEGIPVTENAPELVKRATQAFVRELGADHVVEVPPVMGGEDFSRYRLENDEIPTFIFWLGAVDPKVFDEAMKNGKKLPALHSSLFQPNPQLAIPTGVRAMSAAAIGLLQAP